MTSVRKSNDSLEYQYESALEEFSHTRDLDEVIDEFKKIINSTSPVPSIQLLSMIANRLMKFRQYNEAKFTFGKILNQNSNHRETWKSLSGLYFKVKDREKAEFCLQKYYSLRGGNAELKPITKKRLSSTGRLKPLPKQIEKGLQKAIEIQNIAPQTTMNIEEFSKRYDVGNIPSVIKRIIQYAQHQIVNYRLFDKQNGEYGSSINILKNEKLIEYFSEKKISHLYKFQEEAFSLIQNNEDVCIVAPTGNGKTEAFLLPSMLKIKKHAGYGVQLLIIYPVKALAKDQVRKITEIADILKLSVGVFDGDVSHYRRQKIFADPPEILVTNPDILHYHLGIGKNSGLFQNLLANTKIVILDEVHTYSGTFGSNMHFIIRRLERVIGNELQFIAASATVANPQAFTSRLLNRPVKVVECKNGRRGRLHFLMVAPFDGMKTFDAVSSLLNSIKSCGKILAFQDSHKSAEFLYQRLYSSSSRVGIHRAGLPKKLREETENRFREGKIGLLIATPTLELGIDIGDLEIVVTPPISVNRAIQRIGRAGRKGQDAVAIIHLNADDPISAYYYKYPDEYFQDVEDIFFDPSNPNVADNQLICASLDHPLGFNEFPDFESSLSRLLEKKLLKKHGIDICFPTDEGITAARDFSIRGTNHQVDIKIQGGKSLGKRSMPLAMYELFPGAYYYAGGSRYRVKYFDFNGFHGYAELVKPKSVWGQTFPLSKMKPEILEVSTPTTNFNGLEIGLVNAKILRSVFGYKLQTPSGTDMKKLRKILYYSSHTRGLLFRVPSISTSRYMELNSYKSSVHSLVHTIILASLPFCGGHIHEIGGLGILPQGYILLFDQATGSGICQMLITHLEDIFRNAKTILECSCLDREGCPKCSFLPRCSQNNTLLDKKGAKVLIDTIIKGVEVPIGSEYNDGKIFIS
jgi:DEAD/DEAH box helicase domain-containing protein